MIKYLMLLSTLLLANKSCVQVEKQDIFDYFEVLYADKKFNGNVLIVSNDTILFKHSLGYARGHKNSKLTNNHLFQIGSIYKEFPAVAIMQLKEMGLLSLNDNLSTFIPDLPEWADKINIEHLLQYSSGLPIIEWTSLFQDNKRVSLDLVLNNLHQIEELVFPAGSDYLYSNYNPFLLIQIIESISKLNFEQYLEQNIFSPFNIEGVIISNRYPYLDSLNYKFAYPFNSELKEDDLQYDLPTICASTVGLYQWFKLLDNFQIISKESVRYLSEKAKIGDNIQAPLGQGDWKNGDLELHLHHGSTGNYECLVRNYKAQGILIILLTNQKNRNLHDIVDEVYNIVQ